jgi:hypothetical protein
MPKVTWLGEDTETYAGPSFTTWQGMKFPKGVAVEVTDAHALAKARINQFFKVTDGEAPRRGRPPKAKAEAVTDGTNENP